MTGHLSASDYAKLSESHTAGKQLCLWASDKTAQKCAAVEGAGRPGGRAGCGNFGNLHTEERRVSSLPTLKCLFFLFVIQFMFLVVRWLGSTSSPPENSNSTSIEGIFLEEEQQKKLFKPQTEGSHGVDTNELKMVGIARGSVSGMYQSQDRWCKRKRQRHEEAERNKEQLFQSHSTSRI